MRAANQPAPANSLTMNEDLFSITYALPDLLSSQLKEDNIVTVIALLSSMIRCSQQVRTISRMLCSEKKKKDRNQCG